VLGYCQSTATRQKGFAKERQNYKRLAKGPLSNWFSIRLSENNYLLEFPEALVITKIGMAQKK